MNIIAARIIEVLKADTELGSLLGSNKNIFAMNLQEKESRKTKYIVVSTAVGSETGDIPVQEGSVLIEGAVSREVAGGFGILETIMSRVDALINKGELNLTNSSWKIINCTRDSSEGIKIDKETSEYFWDIEYSFMLDESN